MRYSALFRNLGNLQVTKQRQPSTLLGEPGLFFFQLCYRESVPGAVAFVVIARSVS